MRGKRKMACSAEVIEKRYLKCSTAGDRTYDRVESKQLRQRGRLGLEYVQCSSQDFPALEGIDQRGLVDASASGSVDDADVLQVKDNSSTFWSVEDQKERGTNVYGR
jgi:hypothetical protein